MQRPFCVYALLAGLLAASPVFAADDAPVFGARSAVLDNGLEVVVIDNPRAPVVGHMIWYKAGAIDEKWGASGIAHYLEHLLFKGTKTVPAGGYSRTVRGFGGDDNAFTSHDYTAYFASVTPDHLGDIMKLEADRMRNSQITPENLASELAVVIEERKQTTESDPGALLREQVRASLFPNHPYGRPVIGWDHEMQTMTGDAARAFYNRFYRPDNAVVVISGDVRYGDALALARHHYGPLKKGGHETRAWPRSPTLTGRTLIERHDARVSQPALMRAIRVPSMRQDADTALALEILQAMLADGASSPLYTDMVRTRKAATDISLSYASTQIDDAVLWISAYPADGVKLADLSAALDRSLAAWLANPIDPARLEEAKARLTDSAVFTRDSILGPAMIVGEARAVGLPLDAVEQWPARIRAVTAQQVQNAAQAVLAPGTAFVEGWLLPDTTQPPKGETP